MNCPKCGNPINPNMKFCAKCGNPVVIQQRPVAPQQPMQQRTVAPQQPVQQRTVAPQPPAQPIQQKTMAPIQPAKPTQPNNAVQQKPAKKKKKKKNIGLRITAIILVIAVLATGGIFLADILLYKSEAKKEGYITDFPVLKQKSQLLVIDDQKFPVDEYEIKVEEHKLGGIFKSDTFGKTEEVFTDKSSNPVYDITFPNDGNYRITLTGVVSSRINEAPSDENNEKTEEKSETIVIIIEVKVDDDDENAIDKAAITSKEGDGPVELPEQTVENTETVGASNEDLDALIEFLGVIRQSIGYASLDYVGDGFDSTTATTADVMQILWDGGAYEDFFDGEVIVVDDYTSVLSPTSGFYCPNKIPQDSVERVCEDIFGVEFDENYINDYSFADGDYCYFSDFSDGTIFETEIAETNLVNGSYETIVVVHGYVVDGQRFPLKKVKVTTSLKTIDSEKVWTLESIKVYDDPSIDGVISGAVEYNGHYYAVFCHVDDAGKTWDEAQAVCESYGGHLVTITSADEQAFITSILPDDTYTRLYWAGSFKLNDWVWITDEPMSYSNWSPGEPSGGQDYMTVLGTYFENKAGCWLDNPLTGAGEPWTLYATGFICEWEKPAA